LLVVWLRSFERHLDVRELLVELGDDLLVDRPEDGAVCVRYGDLHLLRHGDWNESAEPDRGAGEKSDQMCHAWCSISSMKYGLTL